jgi:hypothetical protein
MYSRTKRFALGVLTGSLAAVLVAGGSVAPVSAGHCHPMVHQLQATWQRWMD